MRGMVSVYQLSMENIIIDYIVIEYLLFFLLIYLFRFSDYFHRILMRIVNQAICYHTKYKNTHLIPYNIQSPQPPPTINQTFLSQIGRSTADISLIPILPFPFPLPPHLLLAPPFRLPSVPSPPPLGIGHPGSRTITTPPLPQSPTFIPPSVLPP